MYYGLANGSMYSDMGFETMALNLPSPRRGPGAISGASQGMRGKKY